jgi:predicted TIM-barrel fold metal-dependent hydrolase
MEKVFDAHIHHLYSMPLSEAIQIFKEEFTCTETHGGIFLSIPHEEPKKGCPLELDAMQNIRMLALKRAFSPNYFAFAGLEHPLGEKDEKVIANEYLRQAEEYFSAGYDGFKMLEGYPILRKLMNRPLCDKVYDKFYSFLEENDIPVIMHLGNPEEYWDISKAPEYAIKVGRVCDESYPTKAELHAEVDGILKKHPRLRLTLAHFGFMSGDVEQARRFLNDYENTLLDTTPGGEQFLRMRECWEDTWLPFFEEQQDKILYGTDLYAFPRDEQGRSKDYQNLVRCRFIREFFETDGEHIYTGNRPFKGVLLDEKIRTKIYRKNAERIYGTPKRIDERYMQEKAEKLLTVVKESDLFAKEDLKYILK